VGLVESTHAIQVIERLSGRQLDPFARRDGPHSALGYFGVLNYFGVRDQP
jgi:hypothetical protein